MIKALGDDDESVRWAAARALGEIGDERSIEPLIRSFGDEDEDVCEAAYDALAEIGKPAIEPLISALEDEDVWVRWYAVNALGEIGDAKAVEPLRRLISDSNEEVRDAAARALDAMAQVSG